MNFKEIVNAFYSPTCVVSVKKQGEGYGEIRIVEGNAKYMLMQPCIRLKRPTAASMF